VTANRLWIDDYILHTGDTNTYMGFSGNDTIVMRTSGTDRITVKSDGNVGIGTATPRGGLDVRTGDGTESDTHATFGKAVYASAGWSGIRLGTPSASAHDAYCSVIESYNSHSANYNSELRFKTSSGNNAVATERMRITSSGNVGIGTNNPDAKLHSFSVLNSGTANILHTQRADNGGYYSYFKQRASDFSATIPLFLFKFGEYNQDGDRPGFEIEGSGGTKFFSVRQNGAVSIAGSLTVAGSGVTSDDRIKYNEEDVTNALTLISQLNPQKYEKIVSVAVSEKEGIWIPTDEEWESVRSEYTYVDEFGLIAQDVRNIPELAFLVIGEETTDVLHTISSQIHSNLTTEEQMTYTPSYVYKSNIITQEEYSNLTPEEQKECIAEYKTYINTQTPLSLNYNGLFVVAVGAIKELKAKNDALETQLASILTRLDALETTETSNTETTTETSNIA